MTRSQSEAKDDEYIMLQHSIRNKLIVFLLAATIIPIATSIIVTYLYTKASVREASIRENSNLIYQGKTNIMNYLDLLNKSTLSVYNDLYNKTSLYKIVEQGYNDYLSQNQIYIDLYKLSDRARDIFQINLYMKKENQSYLFINDLLKKAESPADLTLPLPETTFDSYVEPSHLSHNYGVQHFFYYAPETVVTMHRPIYKVPSHELLGVLSVDFRLDFIKKVSEQLYTKGREEIYIIAGDGTVVFSSNEQQIGRKLTTAWSRKLLDSSNMKGSFESKESHFEGINVYETISEPYLNWKIVKRIPFKYLYEDPRQLTKINSTVFILFLFVVVSATLFISIRFTAPIKSPSWSVIMTTNISVKCSKKQRDVRRTNSGTSTAMLLKNVTLSNFLFRRSWL